MPHPIPGIGALGRRGLAVSGIRTGIEARAHARQQAAVARVNEQGQVVPTPQTLSSAMKVEQALRAQDTERQSEAFRNVSFSDLTQVAQAAEAGAFGPAGSRVSNILAELQGRMIRDRFQQQLGLERLGAQREVGLERLGEEEASSQRLATLRNRITAQQQQRGFRQDRRLALERARLESGLSGQRYGQEASLAQLRASLRPAGGGGGGVSLGGRARYPFGTEATKADMTGLMEVTGAKTAREAVEVGLSAGLIPPQAAGRYLGAARGFVAPALFGARKAEDAAQAELIKTISERRGAFKGQGREGEEVGLSTNIANALQKKYRLTNAQAARVFGNAARITGNKSLFSAARGFSTGARQERTAQRGKFTFRREQKRVRGVVTRFGAGRGGRVARETSS